MNAYDGGNAELNLTTSLIVDPRLRDFVENELAPGTGISAEEFWSELAEIVDELGPRNARLLQRRDELQTEIDQWYRKIRLAGADLTAPKARRAFLRSIGYLVERPADFHISTRNVDPEIGLVAGPQLVVPVDNARYAINAANARWGSLFDAFYGTDAIPEDEGTERGNRYNPQRGAEVIRRATEFLDQAIPLEQGSHADATCYRICGNAHRSYRLKVDLRDGSTARPANPTAFRGLLRHGRDTRAHPAAAQRPAHRAAYRSDRPDRQGAPGRHRRHHSGVGCDNHPGLRRLGCSSGRRGQAAGLPQLARDS